MSDESDMSDNSIPITWHNLFNSCIKSNLFLLEMIQFQVYIIGCCRFRQIKRFF